MLGPDGKPVPPSVPAERNAAPAERDIDPAGPDVVVSEFCLYDAIRLLRQGGRVEYDPSLARDAPRLADRLAGARALVVRNQTRVTESLLAGAPRLEVVGRLGTGLDNIDVEACARHGVRVVYAPGASASAVAEMTLALALALAKGLPVAVRLGRTGTWSRSAYHGWELEGKTWGILGLGAVGMQVAHRASALGMRVIAHHPRRGRDDRTWRQCGAEPTSRQEVLEQADVLSLHLPLTNETRLSVGAAELALMKPTAVLINTARGGILDEAALADALDAGRLAGAALDVRQEEPPPPGDRLQSLENVILTPHLAGLTDEAQRRVCLGVAGDVLRVLAGETPVHAV
ncbi:MAG: hydroxyacid dehydrogenase [Bacillota bacterium]